MAEEAKKSKAARRNLKDLPSADREMAVMQKARRALATLDTPEARIRVVNWLSAVAHSEVPAHKPQPTPATQLTLDDLPGE
jgi:hypothetical protein